MPWRRMERTGPARSVCEARQTQPALPVQQSPQECRIARTYPLLAGSGSLYGDSVRGLGHCLRLRGARSYFFFLAPAPEPEGGGLSCDTGLALEL